MSDKLKKLLDKRARAWDESKAIRERIDEAGDKATAEDQTAYRASLDDVEQLSEQIETEERAQRLDGAMKDLEDRSAPNPSDGPEGRSNETEYAQAFGEYLREGFSGLDREQRDVLGRGEVKDKEIRALASGTGSAGGYTIPTDLLNKMTETLKMFGGLLGVANVITTATGNPLQWPTNNDTGNVGAILAENTQIAEQDVAFGTNDLGAYTYTSKLMRVPWTLLQDSAFDLESFLGRKAGERIGRALAPHLATGDGVGKPTGLFASATSAGTTATATGVTFDELIDLEHSVDPAYRQGGRCRWVFNDQTLKVLRKIKDADGNYIWEPSTKAGVASTLLGYAYTIDQGVADAASTNKAVGFGDVEAAFTVRAVSGGSMVTLRERYADFLQNGYFAFQRYDSSFDDSSAFKVLTQKA